LEHLETFERDRINALSITAAQGWHSLFAGLAGKGGIDTVATDLLPYQIEGGGKVDDLTRKTIQLLAAQGRLPAKVVGLVLAVDSRVLD
jgi:hypothetical protein